MEDTVPKGKKSGNITKYTNRKIKKLRKLKSELLTKFNKKLKTDPTKQDPQTREIQKLLKLCKKQLDAEFNTAVEKHWINIYKKINYQDSERFMLTINNIFRPTKKKVIKELKIKDTNRAIIDMAGFDCSKLPIIDNEYIITNEVDINNTMGAHYLTINSPRYLNINTRLKDLIDNRVNKFREVMIKDINEGLTFMKFTNDNKASSANSHSLLKNYFTDYITVKLILKYLPNKISSGIDKIPPIVLKHLPDKIIED